jgi:hypothetical protein
MVGAASLSTADLLLCVVRICASGLRCSAPELVINLHRLYLRSGSHESDQGRGCKLASRRIVVVVGV